LRFVTDSFYEITARCCRPQEDSGSYYSRDDRLANVNRDIFKLNSLYYDSPCFGFASPFPTQSNRVFDPQFDYAGATHMVISNTEMLEPTAMRKDAIRPAIAAMADVDAHGLTPLETLSLLRVTLYRQYQKMECYEKNGIEYLRSKRTGYPFFQLCLSPGKIEPLTDDEVAEKKENGFTRSWRLKKAGRLAVCLLSGCGERKPFSRGTAEMYEENEEYMRRSAEQCYRLKYNEDKGCKEWDPRSPRESRECLWHLITPSDNSAPYWEREYFSGFSYHQYQVNQPVRSKDTGSRVFFTLQEDRPRQEFEALLALLTLIEELAPVYRGRYEQRCKLSEERCFSLFARTRFSNDELSPDFSK